MSARDRRSHSPDSSLALIAKFDAALGRRKSFRNYGEQRTEGAILRELNFGVPGPTTRFGLFELLRVKQEAVAIARDQASSLHSRRPGPARRSREDLCSGRASTWPRRLMTSDPPLATATCMSGKSPRWPPVSAQTKDGRNPRPVSSKSGRNDRQRKRGDSQALTVSFSGFWTSRVVSQRRSKGSGRRGGRWSLRSSRLSPRAQPSGSPTHERAVNATVDVEEALESQAERRHLALQQHADHRPHSKLNPRAPSFRTRTHNVPSIATSAIKCDCWIAELRIEDTMGRNLPGVSLKSIEPRVHTCVHIGPFRGLQKRLNPGENCFSSGIFSRADGI